jgi:large subunit ribosomal protein L6
MSRIGRQPITIPDGVTVTRDASAVQVKGPKGTLSERLPASISIEIAEGQVTLSRPDDSQQNRSLHGLARALLANMVKGVTEPFSKNLEIQGVGYRAEVKGKSIVLLVGFSHPIEMAIPEGLSVSVDRNVLIEIQGISRQSVGQFAANIRSVRPPEPYKGKGIRYVGEHIRRKVGKSGATAA